LRVCGGADDRPTRHSKLTVIPTVAQWIQREPAEFGVADIGPEIA
jgi:hypothetical protein